MKCLFCKGNYELSKINHIVDTDGHIIIIKNVPAFICKQCGEYFLENDIAIQLERILEEIEKNHAEVFITNYNDMVA